MSDSMNAQKAFTVHTMFSQFATKRALGKAMQVASIHVACHTPPQLPILMLHVLPFAELPFQKWLISQIPAYNELQAF